VTNAAIQYIIKIGVKWYVGLHGTRLIINVKKRSDTQTPLLTSPGAIERVSTSYKLLDTNLSSAYTTSKAIANGYFLKQLNRAGVPYKHLLHFSISTLQ